MSQRKVGPACVSLSLLCYACRFYCHPQREYLRSSMVNDGVCDCCDGSDEHMLSSSYACGNACAAIEQAHRAQEARSAVDWSSLTLTGMAGSSVDLLCVPILSARHSGCRRSSFRPWHIADHVTAGMHGCSGASGVPTERSMN